MLNKKTILITGGTGSFGNRFTERILNEYNPKKIVIYSRDEYKQFNMNEKFQNSKIEYIIGDVRDKERLNIVCKGIDVIIHTAALKHVPALENNPTEGIDTIINGAKNVIDAAINQNVKKVIALSTDKAVYPINLYGAAKMISDKLFVNANFYANNTIFSVVRYGNVSGSRGSVIPYFRDKLKNNEILPVTDYRMTRFWITLDEGIDLVFQALKHGKGTEIYVSKIPSFYVKDLALSMSENIMEVGIRPGEKLNECMITSEDSIRTYEYDGYYIIYPHHDKWSNKYFTKKGKLVKNGFVYTSDTNSKWLSKEDLKEMVKKI